MDNNSGTFNAQIIRHTNVAYEKSDLSHHAVFAFLLILGCGVFVVLIAMWGIFRNLGNTQYAGHQTTNPIMTSNEQLQEVGGDPALSFPAPRLQPDDIADLNKFRVNEEEQLNSYGWVDPGKNKIHIPIERALDMLGSAWPQQQETPRAPQQNQTGKVTNDDRNGNYGW
jgi:hypothetical protein